MASRDGKALPEDSLGFFGILGRFSGILGDILGCFRIFEDSFGMLLRFFCDSFEIHLRFFGDSLGMLQYIFEIHGQITRFFLILEILLGFFGDSSGILWRFLKILSGFLKILCGFFADSSSTSALMAARQRHLNRRRATIRRDAIWRQPMTTAAVTRYHVTITPSIEQRRRCRHLPAPFPSSAIIRPDPSKRATGRNPRNLRNFPLRGCFPEHPGMLHHLPGQCHRLHDRWKLRDTTTTATTTVRDVQGCSRDAPGMLQGCSEMLRDGQVEGKNP